jgi:hypothetical protein
LLLASANKIDKYGSAFMLRPVTKSGKNFEMERARLIAYIEKHSFPARHISTAKTPTRSEVYRKTNGISSSLSISIIISRNSGIDIDILNHKDTKKITPGHKGRFVPAKIFMLPEVTLIFF